MAGKVSPSETATMLDAVTSDTTSAAFQPETRNVLFEITISGTATVKIQGSSDNSTWYDLSGSTTTSSARYSINEQHQFLRADASSLSAATVSVKMTVGYP